jgi:uncharacterized protein (TIGR04141 family)
MRITLFLLRDPAPAGSGVLHAPDRFREVNLADADGVTWQLLVSGGVAHEASWVKSLRPIIEDDELAELQTLSSSAVLLVLHGNRAFALTFGHGYHAIDPKYVERGFGLRVAANVIAANRVTSADTRGMSGTGRNQKTMLATASDLYALGIEPTEEWVRQLSGEASEKSFAATAAGADSLQLTTKDFSLAGLPQKLGDIWSRYQSDAYRAEFGFLDNFIRLDRADPAVSELDEVVEEMVLAEDAAISFAAPDPFEQLRVDHYAIKYRKE